MLGRKKMHSLVNKYFEVMDNLIFASSELSRC